MCFLILIGILLSTDYLKLLSPMESFPSTSSEYIEDWYKSPIYYNLGGKAITLDDSGNIYVTGNSTDQNGQIYLLKYDSSGNLLWETSTGGPESEGACDLAIDDSGNVIIAGYTRSYGKSLYFVKFDPSGTSMWAHSWPAQYERYAIGIEIDNKGNIYVIDNKGYMLISDSFGNWLEENIYLGYPFLDFALDNSGNIYAVGQVYNDEKNKLLVSKYNSSGNWLWNNTWWLADALNEYPEGIDVDSTGNVYITGYVTYASTEEDLFLIKFDTSGNPVFDSIWESSDADYSYGITLDNSSGNVYITGKTENNAVLLKYDSSGSLLYNDTFSIITRGEDVAVDSWGNVYITGEDFAVFKLSLDTDEDGLSDYDELSTYSTDPSKSDTDGDGLNDYSEVITYKTDPNSSDTDGDGYDDGQEIQIGTDPLSELSNLTLIIVIPAIVISAIAILLILIIKRKSIKSRKVGKKRKKKTGERRRDSKKRGVREKGKRGKR